MSNSDKALKKELITHCVLCGKYIEENQQTSTKKYCSPFCYQKSKRARGRKIKKIVRVTIIDPKVTRRKMQEEINELCSQEKK